MGEKTSKKAGEFASGFSLSYDYQYVGLALQMLRAAISFKLVKAAKMTRLKREQLFTPDEMAIVHVMNRAVRRCFLMGLDEFSGRNYDCRKDWIELRIEHLANYFSIGAG